MRRAVWLGAAVMFLLLVVGVPACHTLLGRRALQATAREALKRNPAAVRVLAEYEYPRAYLNHLYYELEVGHIEVLRQHIVGFTERSVDVWNGETLEHYEFTYWGYRLYYLDVRYDKDGSVTSLVCDN